MDLPNHQRILGRPYLLDQLSKNITDSVQRMTAQ